LLFLFLAQDIAHEDGGYRPHVRVNVLGDGLQLAGFQMTLTGRFWVTPEAEEQEATIGRVMLEDSESRRKIAALKANLTKACEKLSAASTIINGVIGGSGYRQMDMEEAIHSIPSSDALLALIRELQAEMKRSLELQNQIKGFNL
jgi:hypothetical protein